MERHQYNDSCRNVLELGRIKDELKARLDQLVAELFGGAVKKGTQEFRLGSIKGEPGQSLKITRTGVNAGMWNDFNPAGCGSGDVIALIQQRYHLSFKEAVGWACEWLGVKASKSEASAESVPGPSLENAHSRPANREFLARRQRRLREIARPRWNG